MGLNPISYLNPIRYFFALPDENSGSAPALRCLFQSGWVSLARKDPILRASPSEIVFVNWTSQQTKVDAFFFILHPLI